MRFGIMAMQLSKLIPSGLKPEEMLDHIGKFSQADLVNQLADQGFQLIELGGDLTLFFPQAFMPSAIEELAELKNQRNLSYTVHLPLWSVEVSTPLEHVREGSVRAIIDVITACSLLEPEVFVLHATGSLAAEFYRMNLPDMAHGLLLRQFQNGARRSIQTILEKTRIPSRKLAIETVEFPFDLTLELAEDLDLSICLDTGHVLVGFSGPVGIFEATEKSLPRLGEVHLHDGPWQGPERKIGYGKDHQPIGKGDLDVGRFLDQLNEANYRRPIIFELQLPEALDSLQIVRSIRPSYVTEF
jgi:sugar phosphate isomerase/epimerase